MSENGCIFSRSGLKTGMDFWDQIWKRLWKMAFFGLKLGLDLEKWAAHPHEKFTSTPPPGNANRLWSYLRQWGFIIEIKHQCNVCHASKGHSIRWRERPNHWGKKHSSLNWTTWKERKKERKKQPQLTRLDHDKLHILFSLLSDVLLYVVFLYVPTAVLQKRWRSWPQAESA